MNFGTIGTNWIRNLFIDAAKKICDFNHVAVYSRNEHSAEKFASKYGIIDTFTDLEEMACSELIDCV